MGRSLVENPGTGDARVHRIDSWFESGETLYFLHLLEPHVPWGLLPSGRRYNDGSVIEGITDDWQPGSYERWRDDPGLVDQGIQRHLLQVGAVDRFMGQLLDRLHESGVYDRALIVVTADHGVSFRPGGWRRHAMPSNVADIAGVPVFVKYPGEKHGRVDPRHAKTIEILPTIADVLGVQLPWTVDGRSLTEPQVTRPVTVGRRHDPAVRASDSAVAAECVAYRRRNAALFGSATTPSTGSGRDPTCSAVRFRRFRARSRPMRMWLSTALSTLPMFGSHPGMCLRRSSVVSPGRRWRHNDDLAIAVNGRVAATTRPYTYQEQLNSRRWSTRTSCTTAVDVGCIRCTGGRPGDPSRDLER